MTEIRSAGPADVDCVVTIEQASFAPISGGFSRRQIRRLLRNPRAHWRLVECLAVACWLYTTNGRQSWARLYSLAVLPKARGQGLAGRLLEDGFRGMAARGLTRCFAEVSVTNEAALRLYRRYGFSERALLPDYYGPAMDGVSLVKSLAT
ncbi:MAG: GNAT family N-acetyltransferase [Acidiferrobacteraceae bacterium]